MCLVKLSHTERVALVQHNVFHHGLLIGLVSVVILVYFIFSFSLLDSFQFRFYSF